LPQSFNAHQVAVTITPKHMDINLGDDHKLPPSWGAVSGELHKEVEVSGCTWLIGGSL
jgi:hypothetical protein